MTEQTQPTDAELEALAEEHLDAVHQFGRLWIEGQAAFARAVLAKWGTPAGAGEVVAWVDERAISWLENSRSHSATITTTLGKAKSSERPMPLHGTPQPTQAQAGAVPLTFEQARAIREGELNASSEGYFGARSKLDTNRNHNLFKAGFERGWDAREDLYAKE